MTYSTLPNSEFATRRHMVLGVVASALSLLAACTPADRSGSDDDTGITGGSSGGSGGESGDEPGSGGGDSDGGSGDESGGSDGSGSGSGPGGDAGGGSDGGGDDSDDSGGGGIRFDTPNGDSAGESGGDAPGCDKIDFLFVVDNSGSMADEQAKVVASFPAFMQAIEAQVTANDFHVMAIDTDEEPTGAMSTACFPDPECCEPRCANSPDAICNNHPCVPKGPCDDRLGAGKINGPVDCGVTSGGRFLTHEQPNLPETFDCVARVGTLGNGHERQAEAAITAISDSMVGPGMCNEGFLRDDAILVVTFLTDEDDAGEANNGSAGGPQAWYDSLVAAKSGNPESIVMLGLIGDTGAAGSQCQPFSGMTGAQDAVQLRELVQMFGDRGFEGSVCANDYIPFFEQAVSLIDTTCDDFIPPG